MTYPPRNYITLPQKRNIIDSKVPNARGYVSSQEGRNHRNHLLLLQENLHLSQVNNMTKGFTSLHFEPLGDWAPTWVIFLEKIKYRLNSWKGNVFRDVNLKMAIKNANCQGNGRYFRVLKDLKSDYEWDFLLALEILLVSFFWRLNLWNFGGPKKLEDFPKKSIDAAFTCADPRNKAVKTCFRLGQKFYTFRPYGPWCWLDDDWHWVKHQTLEASLQKKKAS